MSKKTIRLVTSGVFIALAIVLSMIKIYQLPYGGSITLVSMLPVMLISYMYGVRWGLPCGIVFGIIQALLGATTTSAFAGVTGLNMVLMALLDYILAFMVLGTAGMFKNKIKNHTVAFVLGGIIAGMLRYLAHFLSGVLLWGSYAEWFFGSDNMNNSFGNTILENFSGTSLVMLYSGIYNGSFMIPEIIITAIAIAIIINIKPIQSQIIKNSEQL